MSYRNQIALRGSLCACMVFMLSACATLQTEIAALDENITAQRKAEAKTRIAESEKARQQAAEKYRASETFKESQTTFAARNPVMKSHIGSVQTVTRMASRAELPEDNYKFWMMFPAEGAGSLALGMVAPPMYASALVVGGIILVPLGTYGYMHEKKIWESINQALTTIEFTRAIDTALKKRLGAILSKRDFPDAQVEIIVHAFGLIKPSSELHYCLVVSAKFSLAERQQLSTQEQLQITPADRSRDAPPPQCNSLENFADNDARLIRDTLAEYAEVIAAMAVKRITAERKK